MDTDMDDVMVFDKESANNRYIKLARGACADESRVDGKEVIIKSNGEVKGRLELRDVCSSYSKRMQQIYQWLTEKMEGFDLLNGKWEDVLFERFEEKEVNEFFFNYTSLLVTRQKAESKLKCNNPEYNKLKAQMAQEIKSIHDKISGENTTSMIVKMLYTLLSEKYSKKMMTSLFNKDTSFSIDDAYGIIKELIPKDELRKNGNQRRNVLTAMPTELIKKLEKTGYIVEGEYANVPPMVIEAYGKDLNYEGKFLSAKSCISAYLYGLMDIEHLRKNFGITGIFNPTYLKRNNDLNIMRDDVNSAVPFLNNEDGKYTYQVHADLMMQILDDVKPEDSYSQGFWNYYMNGILTKEQIMKCTENGWMDIRELCHEYIESKRIPNHQKSEKEDNDAEYYDEVPFLFDDDKKLLEFFSPDVIVDSLLFFKNDKDINNFISQYMKDMYKNNGKNFSEEIYKALRKKQNEEKEPSDGRIQNIIDMYTDNYIGIDQIKNHPLSNEELEELKRQGLENRLLVVDLYNNHFVSQDELFERYEEDEVFGMINRGMNPKVLIGYYGTKELINFILTNKINNHSDLSSLRPGINIEDIKSMYQGERNEDSDKTQVITGLSYDDLNMLVTYGIITKEEADEIDQAYDYKAKVDKLIEQGLIVGDKNGTKVARNEGDGLSAPGTGYGPGKIDELDKCKLLSALDEDAIELELNSDVLRNYGLIIMPNDRIAIMEPTEDGQGASYVMSIKLALEQISSSENIDGDEVVDPLKEYANRTGIRSIPGMEIANHRENWGYNLRKKMEIIHPNMNDLIYSRDKDEQEKNTRRAKIEKMQKEIQIKYLQEREKAKNFNNIEVE